VYENRVLRRIFSDATGGEVLGGWRRLRNEEIHKVYASPNIIWVIRLRMRWAECVARMVEMMNVYSIVDGKPERKRPF
jgi:hypothetical protein